MSRQASAGADHLVIGMGGDQGKMQRGAPAVGRADQMLQNYFMVDHGWLTFMMITSEARTKNYFLIKTQRDKETEEDKGTF